MKKIWIFTKQGKIGTSLITALLILGIAWGVNTPGISQEESLLTKLFLIYIGAIIALQVVPALILVSGMLRGLKILNRRHPVDMKRTP